MDQNSESLLYNRNVRTAVIAVTVILGVFLIVLTIGQLLAWRTISRGAVATNTISVSGHGEVTAKPDVASFSFSVVEKATDAKEAQDTAAKKTNDILAYLAKQGIDEKDVQTSNYSINPTYRYDNRVCVTYPCPPVSDPVITGYQVDETVIVKVRDTSKISTLLSGIGEYGVQNLSGLQFTVDNKDELTRQAQIKAIEDARKNAEQMAQALGVHIIRVVSYYENQPYYGYGGASERSAVQAMDAKSVAPQVSLGENKYTSDISVNFEIR